MELQPLSIHSRLQAAIACSRALQAEARHIHSLACEARMRARNTVLLAREERVRSEDLALHCLLYREIRAIVLEVFREREALKRAGATRHSAFLRPNPVCYAGAAWQQYLELSKFKGNVQ